MERSKQKKHFVCDTDNDVDDDSDNCVDNGDDCVDDCNDNGDKHLTHLSQAADCCLMERSMQNKHVVCNKDNNVEDCVDHCVDNGDDVDDDFAD
eukprot:4870828-Ditylum_brightwellii.AAC.1